MDDDSMRSALLEIDQQNRRFEASFAAGDFGRAADEFYTPNVRYLTGQLEVLLGRRAIADFFTALSQKISAVYIQPVESFGDPSQGGVIYQLCNTVQHLADGGRGYGHYVAAFRHLDGTWFCEMETPAPGWIGAGPEAAAPAG